MYVRPSSSSRHGDELTLNSYGTGAARKKVSTPWIGSFSRLSTPKRREIGPRVFNAAERAKERGLFYDLLI